MFERSSGILMPVSSLPSPYGIGTLGRAAYDFVDFLCDAGQSWWQVLPVGPTSFGDSPYQSFSSFAGNPYFIDLDMLVEDGLLTKEEIDAVDFGDRDDRVNYGRIYNERFKLLETATERGWARDAEKTLDFARENRKWLSDYALFMALKRHFGMRSWAEWDDESIRMRTPEAVERYTDELSDDIRLFTYIQYLFFKQWAALREYAKERGVGIIGDLPIYVAMDSADVWAEPQFFQLDEKNVPTSVAGVPPDYFSADGQLWGNPLYRWDVMKNDGYGWWIRRVEGARKLYDAIRIDHFRGLESYWSVPYGETTAKNGKWLKGPGIDFVHVITSWFSDMRFIAEDLGYLTPEVRDLLSQSGLPGMKVLQFAFDAREPSNYLPHTYTSHCVCYTGTHDNTTAAAWEKEAAAADVEYCRKYLAVSGGESIAHAMIRAGMASVAELFVAQLQDYLELGADCRMNTPGTLGLNWQWRVTSDALTPELAEKIRDMTVLYGRYTPEAEEPEDGEDGEDAENVDGEEK